MKGVLDTGCQGSAISGKFLQRHIDVASFPMVEVARPRGANDEPLDCSSKVFLPTMFGDLVFMIGFYVVRNLAVDLLIGQDVLMKATICQVDRELLFKKEGTRLPIEYYFLPALKDQKIVEEPGVLHFCFQTNEEADEFERMTQEGEQSILLGSLEKEDSSESMKNILKSLDDELEAITQSRSMEASENIANASVREREMSKILDQKEKIRMIMYNHPQLFVKSFQAGTLRVPPVQLEFKKERITPIVSKLRPLAHSELKVVEEWIKESLEKGIIEESDSAWRSTVFPVAKPDEIDRDGKKIKKYRIVTPFFGLNKLLSIRATPMPHILDVQGAVAGATRFTTLDLRESFFQIPLAEESKEYTAFGATGTRLYHYRVIPMGCSISTGLLQSALTRILSDDYFRTCISYADDILIFSKGSEEEHWMIVNKILQKLEMAGAKVKLEKVQLCKEEVNFLGMRLSKEGWSISEKFKLAVQEAPRPTCLKSLRSFIGLTNWQRRFIPKYSQIAKPLTDIIKCRQMTVKEAWGKEQEEAFLRLKEELISSKVLAHPSFDREFYMFSDASDTALGACLCQKDEMGKMRVIGYTSRKFRPSEVSRGIPEKETMALVEGLENFRPFVLGYQTICYVDQRSLRWLLEKNHPSKYTRYRERLELYDYEIRHINGVNNKSDWVSRYAGMNPIVQSMSFNTAVWQEMLDRDPFWRVMKGLEDGVESGAQTFKWGRLTFDRKHFVEDGGVWKYNGLILVPAEGISDLLKRTHDDDVFSSHQGVVRTMQLIKRNYYWPTMRDDIRNYVRACSKCQRNKRGRLPEVPKKQLEIPDRKFGTICVDVWGYGALSENNGYKGVLTVIDRLTNYVQFLPIKSREMEEMMKVLARGWIARFGFPDKVHADNEFDNAWQDAFCEYYGVKKSFTGFYAPFQNGQVERVHRFLGDQIRMIEGEKDGWSEYLEYIAAKYNSGWCSAVNESPHFLVYGQDFRNTSDEDETILRRIGTLFADVQRLRLIDENVRKYREQKFKDVLAKLEKEKDTEVNSFVPGDVVWWRNQSVNPRVRKLDSAAGPFRIMRIVGDNLIEMDRIDGKNRNYIRVATSQLRLCLSEEAEI